MTLTLRFSLVLVAAAVVAGCATRDDARRADYVHRFQRPAAEAARCFARNAEAHSSALVATISGGARQPYDVVVRVKNGAPYATARISDAGTGAGAQGLIELYVQASQGDRQLVDALVSGC